jgi:hypothetical protein
MKIRQIGLLLAGMLLTGVASSYAAAEAYYIVKVQDMTKEATTKVMSATELKEMEKTIQLETQCFPQAVAAAAKAWREDESNKGTPFAGARVSPRKIVGPPERFTSQAKAEEKLTALEAIESKKADREAEREFAKARAGKAVKKSKEEIAREFKKESDAAAAMELIQAKLTEIMAAKAAAPAGGAAVPKAPDAAAKEAGQKAL